MAATASASSGPRSRRSPAIAGGPVERREVQPLARDRRRPAAQDEDEQRPVRGGRRWGVVDVVEDQQRRLLLPGRVLDGGERFVVGGRVADVRERDALAQGGAGELGGEPRL